MGLFTVRGKGLSERTARAQGGRVRFGTHEYDTSTTRQSSATSHSSERCYMLLQYGAESEVIVTSCANLYVAASQSEYICILPNMHIPLTYG